MPFSTVLTLFRDFDYELHEVEFLDLNKNILARLAPPKEINVVNCVSRGSSPRIRNRFANLSKSVLMRRVEFARWLTLENILVTSGKVLLSPRIDPVLTTFRS